MYRKIFIIKRWLQYWFNGQVYKKLEKHGMRGYPVLEDGLIMRIRIERLPK